MKILVTGGSGFVGSRLLKLLNGKHEIYSPTHSEMDICNPESIDKAICGYRPDAVIHCAALSNTWYCEQHPEESFKVNVEATRDIAAACARIGAKLIFMSSDQVYNGTAIEGPLPEGSSLAPVNHYGRHKLLAEQKVMEILPSAVGLRLTWMYDRPDSTLKLNTNILVNLAKAGMNGETIKAATHEHRGMTNVWEVAGNIVKCLSIPGGIYNFGSRESLTSPSDSGSVCNPLGSYGVFRECAALMGLPEGTVAADEERFSEQPRNLAMDTSRVEALGIRFRDTMTGLRETIAG